jgi:hypothetical protein
MSNYLLQTYNEIYVEPIELNTLKICDRFIEIILLLTIFSETNRAFYSRAYTWQVLQAG